MPLSKSVSFYNKFRKSKVREECEDQSVALRTPEGLQEQNAHSSFRRKSVSVDLIHELKSSVKFKERQTLDQNRLSKSFSNVTTDESSLNKSVSQIVSQFENRSSSVTQTLPPKNLNRQSSSLSSLTPRTKKSIEELLKAIQLPQKEKIETLNKFPLDDETVEIRRKNSIAINRQSKTVDFDSRKKDSSKDFVVRGLIYMIMPSSERILINPNEDQLAYKNSDLIKMGKSAKQMKTIATNVTIKSLRYSNVKSKECKEVEMKDMLNNVFMLYFKSFKYAKQFMEDPKVQIYVVDNKVTIKKTLLRFLGKRSSQEILEKKGIYKNEPIFGNTLRDIHTKVGSLVPQFVHKVIELIERPENLRSVGLYRTSGNLATIQKIRYEVDNGSLDILNQFAKDPDVLTGSLKLFFRELKEPLVPRDVCDKLADITKLDPKEIPTKDKQKIRQILSKNLHEANLETLVVLMRHLLEVTKYKEHNKMDAYNLAVCWGQSIVFHGYSVNSSPTLLPKDIVMQSHDATRLVDFLLSYFEANQTELEGLKQRPESSLNRQESRDSFESQKSLSSASLSVDETVKKLIEIIEENLPVEGLYRKQGSSEKVAKIMKKLNKKKIGEVEKYRGDVHDVAEALKRYLRDQDSLLTKESVEMVLKIPNESYLEPITRRKIVSLIEETPKKDTLVFLLRHLTKVIELAVPSQRLSKSQSVIDVWATVLNNKSRLAHDDVTRFLGIAVKVYNDNLPDVVRSSFGNNGGMASSRNESMQEVVKQIKHQQAERDRNSRYDYVDCDVIGEAAILEDVKTEQTKL